ncbi:MAG: bifunctional hydroxymethylpyrimidine kinase/phosphomethylpyrimidine kinase [Gaiellaceae bacterium]
MSIARVLTIASSDSGGGAGVQADLKAFAAAGCFGMSAIVALTAQNTVGVTAIHELPPEFVSAQLEAVFADIGVDAVKTGMLFSAAIISAVAEGLSLRHVPLVVDPVMIASSGARLLREDAVEALVTKLFPLATVVTPNQDEATALVGPGAPDEQALKLVEELGARAAIVTGSGSGDWLFDGELTLIGVRRVQGPTHGSGCTHSAILAACLARGMPLVEAASEAAQVASEAIAQGLAEIGAGEGPVDVLNLKEISRYE